MDFLRFLPGVTGGADWGGVTNEAGPVGRCGNECRTELTPFGFRDDVGWWARPFAFNIPFVALGPTGIDQWSDGFALMMESAIAWNNRQITYHQRRVI
jgi:hypothetical protein